MNKRHLFNAAWMVAEKIVSLAGVFLVTAFVAKYIGADSFGKLALATACFQIVQIAAQMGSDNVIFKRVSKNAASGRRLIKATLLLRTLLYFTLSLPVMGWFIFKGDSLTLWFCISTCIAFFFSSLDVYAIYNNARLLSKTNTYVNITGLSISLLIRYAIAFFKLPVEYLAAPVILTTFIPFVLRIYLLRVLPAITLTIKQQKRYTLYLLRSGMSLVISSLSIAIYTRLSVLLLAWMIGNRAAGLFTVASTLSSSWLFVTSALVTSSYTAIFNCKDEKEARIKTASLSRVTFCVALTFILLIFAFGKVILAKLYGPDFLPAWPAIKILSVAALFSSLGPVAYRYIIFLSGYHYLSVKMFFLLLINFPLCWILVGSMGLTGAAFSVLITEILSLTIMNYFFSSAVILKLHLQSFYFFREAKNEKTDQTLI